MKKPRKFAPHDRVIITGMSRTTSPHVGLFDPGEVVDETGMDDPMYTVLVHTDHGDKLQAFLETELQTINHKTSPGILTTVEGDDLILTIKNFRNL